MIERPNVYKLPQGDTTLEWYEKAVAKMKTRPTTDPTSWNYQAAIHGFMASNPFWSGAAPLPSQGEQLEYWQKCQHGSWYFLPWHRMYLAYFEQTVAATVVELGGPEGWALPFWDYSDTSNPNALNIPPAFTSPSDSSNNLWIQGRVSNTLNPRYVTLGALRVIPFTGDGVVRRLGFGGPETGFSHSGSTHGRLESLPHDMVHVNIGGAMGDPRTAALDPIFWLHHANIDRLWQVWLNQGGRANPTEADWLNYEFDFHDSQGKPTSMAAKDVEDTTKVLSGYTYQGVPATPPAEQKLAAANTSNGKPFEVVGASNTPQPLQSSAVKTTLKLTPSTQIKGRLRSLAKVETEPCETYLHFENVSGTGVPPIYDVYLNIPDGSSDNTAHYAGSLPLFGVEESSIPSEHHSGSGQHYALDVSELMSKLRTLPNWQEDKLNIHLEPSAPLPKGAKVQIGRISLYCK